MREPRPIRLEETHRLERPEAGWAPPEAKGPEAKGPEAKGPEAKGPEAKGNVCPDASSLARPPIEAFARDLASRTTLSAEASACLAALDRAALSAETARTVRAESAVRDRLSELIHHPDRATQILGALEPWLLARDRGWRELLVELQRLPPSYDQHKKLALVKFRQYLLTRRDALERLWRELEERTLGPDGWPGEDDLGAEQPFEPTRCELAVVRSAALPHFVRLPRGLTVAVEVAGGGFELRLASHAFRVLQRPGGAPVILDDNGARLTLREGLNMVGRALYNDAVIAAEFTDVSRRHLVVEVARGRVVSLRDLSSEGTFVPRECLASSPDGP